MLLLGKKRIAFKTELKPKELVAFIKNKITSLSDDEGFSLVKIEPDYLTRLNSAHYKVMLNVLKQRISDNLSQDDRFCVLSEGGIIIYINKKYTEAELSETGWQIITECCQPIDFDGLTFNPEINAGLAVYPDSGKTFDALMDSLTIAVTVSKREGVNTFSVYTPKLSEEKSKEYKQLAELKYGVNKNQFLLHYQPVVNMKTAGIYGAEALLRWRHPILGIVSPKDFFDVIEASGEIYQLGLWTFEQMLKFWSESRVTATGQFVYSLNLSAKQLIQPSLLEDIKRIVKKIPGLNMREICFEISCFTAALNDDTILNNIEGLSKMGFLIALDNYGDIDIPINTLLKLSVNIVKCKGSCFAENYEAIKENLNQLVWRGSNYGIAFIAEGIENQKMLALAQSVGITLMQGFYFARPAAAEDFALSVKNIIGNFI